MPVKTNLNIYPYYDDYNEKKDFYRVLFKPGVSVQMRELNQLQTILQNQIERFGNNIFTRGTIISGCNFQFYTPYPYIKIPDTQSDGTPTSPGDYLGKFVVDDVSELKGFVVNYADGFELSDPDLKTLYVNYINSGTDGNTTAFVPGNNVTIYDGSYPVDSVDVLGGGTGFANSDQLVISPVLVVNVVTGAFAEADYLVNPLTGANAEILTIDTSTVSGKALIKVKPRDVDLTNSSVNSTAWEFALYESVTNVPGSAAGVVEQIYGENAQGRIVTDSVGAVNEVTITGGGRGYLETPSATIKTANSGAGVALLSLSPKNFVARLQVSEVTDAVGNGYAFGVTEGIAFQQGFFLRVEPQTVIVDKYSSSPNNVAVGFSTNESVITAQEDDTLYENALGSPNEFAPGADRLKLAPSLLVMSKEAAAANDEFFTLVEWNDGFPYKQNRVTNYSRIGDHIGDSVYDSSGNFVMDAFNVTTESVANTDNEGTHYTAVVDPGQGYINGKKVQTLSNYKVDMQKGTDTKVANNVISLNYGNYLRVNNFGGLFDFSAGGTIQLYDKPASYVANTATITTGTITAQGAQIGIARIRSIELESGYPGTVSSVWRIYLFDINMNAGQNFRAVKSLYSPGGTYKGICDVILTYDATTSSNVAQLYDTGMNSLIFASGVESLKNSNTSTYVYRTSNTANVQISNGKITISLADPSEFFPYTGDLAGSQMQELQVVPVEAAVKCINATGTVAVNTTSNLVTGSGTSFIDYYAIGDYIETTDGAANVATKRVVGVINNTSVQVDSVFAYTMASENHRRVFPKNLPVPFGQRQGLYANVDGTGQVLSIEFRHANNTAMSLDYVEAQLDSQVAYNVERRNVESATKTATRNKYVKIALANTTNGIDGPWCLGVPDAFRLRAVFVGNSTVNAASAEITPDFFIDHNQNANYMGLSYLFKRTRARTTISRTDYLLCCFDYFVRDNAGYYDTRSYARTANTEEIANIDALTFNDISANSSANPWEIPEVYTYDGKYYDLHSTFDFRPAAANTVLPAASPATAPVNPSDTVSFSGISKFPRPNAVMRTQIEQYLGRIDDIYISENGSIFILKGIPDVNPRSRYQSNHPKDALRLQTLVIPPYPNLPRTIRNSVMAIVQTGISNERFSRKRQKTHTIEPLLSSTNQQTSQPMVYTMEDIANLDRRVKDLEYYVSLSVLETNLTNKIIPSSIDPQLNRFKFGFFADDFSTQLYCDLDNPAYAASIEFEGSDDIAFGSEANPFNVNAISNTSTTQIQLQPTNRCVPPKQVLTLRHFTENSFYVDQFAIDQNNATMTLKPCVVDMPGTGTIAGNAYLTSVNRRTSTVYLEDLPGLVTVYFDILPVANSGLGSRITVTGANNIVIASTDVARNSAKQLSAGDKTFLSTSTLAKDFYISLLKSTFTTPFQRQTASGWTDLGQGAGKLQFSTQGGGKFIVTTESPDAAPNWKYLVEFPSIFSANQNIVNTPECDPNPPVFKGNLEAGKLSIVQWSCSNVFRVNTTGYKAFILLATGLKPNTIHKFYMDTQEWPEVILLSKAMFTASQYDPGRGSGDHTAVGVDEVLSMSTNRKANEVNRFLQTAMTNLYDAAGNPGPNTVLKTDSFGKMRFLVFFPLNISGWFSQDFNAPSYRLDYAGYDMKASHYGEMLTPTYGSSGYTSLVLQDSTGSSQAARVFANRTPNKTIPDDPRGFI